MKINKIKNIVTIFGLVLSLATVQSHKISSRLSMSTHRYSVKTSYVWRFVFFQVSFQFNDYLVAYGMRKFLFINSCFWFQITFSKPIRQSQNHMAAVGSAVCKGILGNHSVILSLNL